MATVTTRTVAVNAAFLQEIKEDNRALHALLDIATQATQQRFDRTSAAARLAELLVKLRDQLALHFALEEAYGYFEDALAVAPRLCERAEKLRAEHVDLFLQLSALADEAERAVYKGLPPRRWAAAISDGFLRFAARFRRHECDENALILAAFDDDIGVGD